MNELEETQGVCPVCHAHVVFQPKIDRGEQLYLCCNCKASMAPRTLEKALGKMVTKPSGDA